MLTSTLRYEVYKALPQANTNLPLISCLLVTKQRFRQVQCAIACFQNQTYENKELIIIDDDTDDRLEHYVHSLQDDRILYFRQLPENKSLGELRNLAVKQASGQYVCQWDDDDLADPMRLEMQMAAIRILGAEACCLQRWLLWWPLQQRLAVSRSRVWEGSLLCLKEVLASYPDMRQGEDTAVLASILQNCRVALLDFAQLYTYVIHEQNTFSSDHFEAHWQAASARYEGNQYVMSIQALGRRVPLKHYFKALNIDVTSESLPFAAAQPLLEQPNQPSTTYLLTEEKQFVDQGNLYLTSRQEPDKPVFLADGLSPNALPTILILTPVKNAAPFLPRYLENLLSLDYPGEKISVAFLESDSSDGTFDWLQQNCAKFKQKFRRALLFQRAFQFHHALPRWEPSLQFRRRSILAKSRNFLLHQSLQDEEWVLWLDVDVSDYPNDVIQQLLRAQREIVVPHCACTFGGKTFDLNTFKLKEGTELKDWTRYVIDGILQPPRGEGRLYLESLRNQEIVQVDGVGATMLLVKADLHREGLIFPPFSYKLHIETEGLAMMAKDMGYTCWGLPKVEIVHSSF